MKCIQYNSYQKFVLSRHFRGGSGLAVLGPPPSSSNRGGAGVFDNIVQRASNPSDGSSTPPPLSEGSNHRRITMYRNGFTVDDGPLRDLVSPESRAFITSLENGDVPQGYYRLFCPYLVSSFITFFNWFCSKMYVPVQS